jgi:hypothetical protein
MHYSLYEFAFNSRVDMTLRTAPFMNTQFNAPLTSIDEMDRVDDSEAD